MASGTTVIGAAGIDINPHPLLASFTASPMLLGGRFFLLAANAQRIYIPPPMPANRENNVRINNKEPVPTNADLFKSVSHAVARGGIRRIQLDKSYLLAHAPVKGTPLTLGVLMPEEKNRGISLAARKRMDHLLKRLVDHFLVIMVFAVLFSAIFGFLSGRFFSDPISELITRVQDVSRGGTWLPPKKNIQDAELQLLSNSVDTMVQAIRENEQLVTDILNGVKDAIFLHDAETGKILRVNRQMCIMYACSEKEAPDLNPSQLSSNVAPYDATHAEEKIRRAAQGEALQPFLWHCRDTNGRLFWGEVSLNEATINGKRVVLAVVRDISDRLKAEEERRALERVAQQRQRLEMIGVLSGGVAHDFNNLLTAVMGHLDLACLKLTDNSAVEEHLQHIRKAALRGNELCRQMLAYAGKGTLTMEPVPLLPLLQETIAMLRSTVPMQLKIGVENLSPDQFLWVQGDQTQLGQVVMNLVLNAADAIGPHPGRIDVTMTIKHLEKSSLEENLTHEPLPAGPYVVLTVTDDGSGMSRETCQRIFEPFFTTKFTGQGLGLASVLGIVKSHHGMIKVSSVPDEGSTFEVAFPWLENSDTSASESEIEATRFAGTVLLVDDEELLREVGVLLLESLGFDVLVAPNGKTAIRLFEEHHDDLAVIILDLNMPDMDGKQVFTAIRQQDTQIPIILASGFSESAVTEDGDWQHLNGFLAKPYGIEELQHVLQQVFPQG